MKRFLFITDIHWGYERRGGHKIPIHDAKAWGAVLAFARDFKPHVIILGGDILDCNAISHHNHKKPGRTEGLKLLADATECYEQVIQPLEELGAQELILLIGNHEQWIDDLVEDIPALEGILSLEVLLKLNKWRVIPQGGAYNLGKLTFIHGDTLSGGEHVAKSAVTIYERNIRFGHVHTFQVFTKTSPLDYKNSKTGIAVPCLCTKTPTYGKGKPNRWTQGFLYGYMKENGCFNDYVSIILDGKTTVNGKVYKG